ncbi:hypothetical protein AADZ84_05930 [Colwelliaceae bacterium MEBiC 14330]
MTQSNSVETEQAPDKERRKSKDLWIIVKIVVNFGSWLAFLVALVMSYYIAPETDYGVLRYYNIEIRQFWLTPLTGYLYILLWLSALGSYVALLIVKYRSRRTTDYTHYNLYILLGVNLIWLTYILFQVL